MNKRIQKKLEKWCYGTHPTGMFPQSLEYQRSDTKEVQRWYRKRVGYLQMIVQRHPNPQVAALAAKCLTHPWVLPLCSPADRWRTPTKRVARKQHALDRATLALALATQIAALKETS